MAEPISLSPEERRRLLAAQKGHTRNMGGTGKDERPNDWVKDFGGALKSAGKGVAHAADAASDVLIDKKAWSDIIHNRATASDWGNAALDASMLIPGAGVLGGAARVGTRLAAKEIAKEGAKVAERKLSPLAERVLARRGAAEGGNEAVAGAVKHRGESSVERLLSGPKAKVTEATERVAAKQELGEGTRIGLGQTKKRIAANALITGGANLGTRAYDMSGKTKPRGKTGMPGAAVGGAAGGQAYLIGNALYPVETGSSGNMQIPESTAHALADYFRNGGSPDGAQVVYIGH